jgi:nitrogen regulatory protein P-II 1
MKRLDLMVPHKRVREVNEILHNYKVGGMTMYNIKGRGRALQEPVVVGRSVMRYSPIDLEQKWKSWSLNR